MMPVEFESSIDDNMELFPLFRSCDFIPSKVDADFPFRHWAWWLNIEQLNYIILEFFLCVFTVQKQYHVF